MIIAHHHIRMEQTVRDTYNIGKSLAFHLHDAIKRDWRLAFAINLAKDRVQP